MKIIITGASGFIGSYLTEELSKEYEILAIDITEPKLDQQNSNIIHLKLDITNINDINNLRHNPNFQDIDGTIHLAAISRVSDAEKQPQKTININILGTLNILELIKNLNQSNQTHKPWFILGSTIEPPTNLYGLTKQFSNQLTKLYSKQNNLKTLVLKFPGVYGLRDNPNKLIPKLIKEAINNQLITVNSPNTQFDFIHISDLIKAISKAVEYLNNNNIIYDEIPLATGEVISIKQIAEIIINQTNSKSKLIIKNQPPEIRDIHDYEKAKQILNWQPEISFKEGIGELVEKIRRG